MPPCYVDRNRSTTFCSLVQALKERFSHIEEDLEEIWVDIARDHRSARNADPMRGFNNTVFKYRSKCSDTRKGARGGYRIIAYYHASNNTLYPIFVYNKLDMEDISDDAVATAVKKLLDALNPDLPFSK